MIRRRLSNNRDAWIPGAIPFFLIGFTYYLASPAVVFRFLSEDNELLDAATKYVYPDYFNFIYLLDALAILVSFLLGFSLAKHGTKAKVSIADYGSHQQSVPSILAISFGGLIVFFVLTASMSGASVFYGLQHT